MKPGVNRLYLAITVVMAISLCSSCAPLPGQEECLQSSNHTLILSSKGYGCQSSRNQCDKNFRQAIDGAELCESKEGCEYLTGICYCPPGVQCVCGGGPPAQCARTDDQRDHLQRQRNMLAPIAAEPEPEPDV